MGITGTMSALAGEATALLGRPSQVWACLWWSPFGFQGVRFMHGFQGIRFMHNRAHTSTLRGGIHMDCHFQRSRVAIASAVAMLVVALVFLAAQVRPASSVKIERSAPEYPVLEGKRTRRDDCYAKPLVGKGHGTQNGSCFLMAQAQAKAKARTPRSEQVKQMHHDHLKIPQNLLNQCGKDCAKFAPHIVVSPDRPSRIASATTAALTCMRRRSAGHAARKVTVSRSCMICRFLLPSLPLRSLQQQPCSSLLRHCIRH